MATKASMSAIQQAYIAFYGRPADFAGQTYWAGVLDKDGGNLDAVIQAFGSSLESNGLYAGSSNAQRIEKIYQQLFNRAPDEAGKNWWAGEIEAGRVSLQSAALQIMNGATGNDMLIIQRKTDAAEQFTETLRSKNMSHAYSENDISTARDFLSAITPIMTDAQLTAKLQLMAIEIYNAAWVKFDGGITSLSYGNSLGEAVSIDSFNGGLIFGKSGRSENNGKLDVYLTVINESLQANKVYVGHKNFSEVLEGVVNNKNNGFVLWGDLDNSYNSQESNLQFIWTIDENLKPLAEVRIGTFNGDAPSINKVLPLSNGKILVVGGQNNIADNWDAFAIVFNSDLTVHAQNRFDSPVQGSREAFSSAIELSNGDLVLVGEYGELFRVNDSLQQVGLAADFNAANIYRLKNDLLLIQDGAIYSKYHIIDSSFNWLSSFGSGNVYVELVEKSPGEFVAYSGGGNFFNIDINFNEETGKVEILSQESKKLVARSGGGIELDYIVLDDTIAGVNGNNLFIFNLDMPATPNLALDYRLIQGVNEFEANQFNNNNLLRPDWVKEEVQIVTVGSAPDFGEEQSFITNVGISFI